jgi:hypothetical protein
MLYNPDPVTAQLWHAADIIDNRGWIQGALCNSSGHLCMLGALRWAARGPDTRAAELRIMAIVRMPVSAWNNTICRSKEQAVAMFRLAACTRYRDIY